MSLAGIAGAIASLDRVNEVDEFHLVHSGADAIVALRIFCHDHVRRDLLHRAAAARTRNFPRRNWSASHFWLAALGILIYAAAAGHWADGSRDVALNQRHAVSRMSMTAMLPFLRGSTTGDLVDGAGAICPVSAESGRAVGARWPGVAFGGAGRRTPKPAGVAS